VTAKKKKIALGKSTEPIEHIVSLPVTENLKHGLYMSMVIGAGNAGKQAVQVSLSGGTLIIQVGPFGEEGGRQFLVEVNELVRAIVEQTEEKE
jgi:hypothetical protein